MIVILGSLTILPTIAIASGLTRNSWASINQWRFGGFGSPFSSRGNQVYLCQFTCQCHGHGHGSANGALAVLISHSAPEKGFPSFATEQVIGLMALVVAEQP